MEQQEKIQFTHLAVPVKKIAATHMVVIMEGLVDIVALEAMATVEGAATTVEEAVLVIVEVGIVEEVVMDIVGVVTVVEVTVAEEVMDIVHLVVIIVEADMDTVVAVIVAVVTVEEEVMDTVEEETMENAMIATIITILDTNLPENLGHMDTRLQTSNVNTKRKLFMLLKLNISLKRNALQFFLRVARKNTPQEKESDFKKIVTNSA